MTKKDQVSGTHRINDAMLDEMLAGTDAAAMFHSGELLSELRQRLAERILDAEMEVHLDQQVEGERGNTRNGHNRKRVLTDNGSMPLAVPRDRQGTFEPQLVEWYCRRLPGFDAKVIQLFAHGMSTRHIQRTVQELYGVSVSPELIAKVTDVVLEEYEVWQSRPLQERYPIVYLDAIQVKVRDAGLVTNRAVYLGIGVAEDGRKEILGLWLGEKEGARYWLMVLNELKARGVKDNSDRGGRRSEGLFRGFGDGLSGGGGSDVHRASAAAFAVECIVQGAGGTGSGPEADLPGIE